MAIRLLFPLLLLAQCLTAQDVTISADVALAHDYCSGTNPDPETDCINVPMGNGALDYAPGVDGSILVTYRVTNNTAAESISELLINDAEYGTVLPVTPVKIGPGQTYTVSRIYPARTLPEVVTPEVTASYEFNGGGGGSESSSYTIDVLGPDLGVLEWGIGRSPSQ